MPAEPATAAAPPAVPAAVAPSAPAAPAAPAAREAAPSNGGSGGPVASNKSTTEDEARVACSPAAASCVTFVSEPQGADIYVDGKFVGNTPSTLALPTGAHEIRVEADNFKTWTRKLASTAGSTVTIHAALTKK